MSTRIATLSCVDRRLPSEPPRLEFSKLKYNLLKGKERFSYAHFAECEEDEAHFDLLPSFGRAKCCG